MKFHKDDHPARVDYDQLAREYAIHRKVQPKVFEQLILGGKVSAHSRVLEVGCGTGNYISAIRATTGCTCSGIDPSSEMLAKAKERSNDVDFQIGRGEQIDFADNSFDLIYSVDVIHHIQDKERYYHEAFRVLSPGGWICTVTESSAMIQNRVPFSVYFPETVNVDLKRYPTQQALRGMLTVSGFSKVRNRSINMQFQHTNIQDFRDKSYSCLHLISQSGFETGVKRMEEDLLQEPIMWNSRYMMVWGQKIC